MFSSALVIVQLKITTKYYHITKDDRLKSQNGDNFNENQETKLYSKSPTQVLLVQMNKCMTALVNR